MNTASSPPVVPHRIRKTVGIDLGTTNSVIALLDPTDSAILTGQDELGRQTFPSVVGYRADKQRLVVGRPALALQGQSSAVVASVKRHLGTERLFLLGPETLTPTQVAARILVWLQDILVATLKDSRYLLDAAVITMPASFNPNQIEATRQAGELAGYEVVELLHEPTAAAIYYAWLENHGDAIYLVYDLGGGTFDVSVIRKHFGDYEVLAVSGDPFLGGDDFDRLLASHIADCGLRIADWNAPGGPFDLSNPEGATNFARLVHAAESVKIELSAHDTVAFELQTWGLQSAIRNPQSAIKVERDTFNRLIKDKVDRTIHCCHEALALARDKAGIRLGDIDYVILVGGSSQLPLVRDTVRAAFCNTELPEHVRCPEPLLSEPDLCVAYGAALRGATHGTRYLFPDLPRAKSFLPDLDLGLGPDEPSLDLELHLTSSPNAQEITYTLTGYVRGLGAAEVRHGGSVRVCALADGSIREAFFDPDGAFALELELLPEKENLFELRVGDNAGRELLRLPYCVHHRTRSRRLGPAVLATQLLTKPLAIEVLDRQRQRVKQVVAPVGATLPGCFTCTCRTVDQAGRIVVPIFEENRAIKQMVIADLDPRLPIGSPVDVELSIDVKHAIQVRVLVREAGRCETATIKAPPPPQPPTQAEIDAVQRQIDLLLPNFSGSYRARIRTRVTQLRQDLQEALRCEDAPKAIQRMAELRDIHEQLVAKRGQSLDPPWTWFAQLVQDCLHLAAKAAETAGKDRAELFAQIHEYERYAEQAHGERNPALYQHCWDNLNRLAGHLEQLLRDAPPQAEQGPPRRPEDHAREELDHFRRYLSEVWKNVRTGSRTDLDARLAQVADQARGLSQRLKEDASAVIREARRLVAEIAKVEQHLKEGRPILGQDAGMLEGTL